jgi:hypothetical protein
VGLQENGSEDACMRAGLRKSDVESWYLNLGLFDAVDEATVYVTSLWHTTDRL